MKKGILALGCMAALVAISSDAFAVNGTATATIGTAISITQDTSVGSGSTTGGDLAFGHIIPNGGGSITITPAGVITPTGIISTTQLPKGPAYFKVTGDAGLHYTATLASTSTTISDGTHTMNVTGLNSDSTGTLSGAGQEVFHVGGILTVAAGQAAGVYTGTFAITAAYN